MPYRKYANTSTLFSMMEMKNYVIFNLQLLYRMIGGEVLVHTFGFGLFPAIRGEIIFCRPSYNGTGISGRSG